MNKGKRHYYRRKMLAIKKLGGKCARCGVNENLEFDHIDPTTKKYNIANVLTYSLDKLMDELCKCQLLCRKCHLLKSMENKEGSWAPYRGRRTSHGASGYRWLKCRCNICKTAYSRVRKEHHMRTGN